MSEETKLQRIADIRAGIMLDLTTGRYIASVMADSNPGHQDCETVFEAQNWICARIRNHFNNDNLYAALTNDVQAVEEWKEKNER